MLITAYVMQIIKWTDRGNQLGFQIAEITVILLMMIYSV